MITLNKDISLDTMPMTIVHTCFQTSQQSTLSWTSHVILAFPIFATPLYLERETPRKEKAYMAGWSNRKKKKVERKAFHTIGCWGFLYVFVFTILFTTYHSLEINIQILWYFYFIHFSWMFKVSNSFGFFSFSQHPSWWFWHQPAPNQQQ